MASKTNMTSLERKFDLPDRAMVYPVQVDLEGDVGGGVIAVELSFNRLRNREVHDDGRRLSGPGRKN